MIALLIFGIILIGISFLCEYANRHIFAVVFAFMGGYIISVPLWEKQQELNVNKNNTAIDTIAVIHDANHLKK